MPSTMSNAKGPEDVEELAARLDREFDEFLDKMIQQSNEKRQSGGNVQTFEEIAAELESHPAFLKEIDPSKPLHPALEALQALKYESEDPTMCAESFKEEGNVLFKKKDFRTAVDNYTQGIKSKSPDKLLNAVLYSNRAAAQFELHNFGYALQDCIIACKFQPDYVKAYVRGTQCCLELKKFSEAVTWSGAGLKLDPKNEKLSAIRTKAIKLQKMHNRDLRKQQLAEKKEDEAEQILLDVIQKRGIKLVKLKESGETETCKALTLKDLEGHNSGGAKVHINEDGSLNWPVLFLYPEYTQSDFIESFNENNCFIDHIHHMFGEENVPWDEERKYHPDKMEIYFQDVNTEILCCFSPEKSLAEILPHKRFYIIGGTPSFILLVKGSKFKEEFLKKYQLKYL